MAPVGVHNETVGTEARGSGLDAGKDFPGHAEKGRVTVSVLEHTGSTLCSNTGRMPGVLSECSQPPLHPSPAGRAPRSPSLPPSCQKGFPQL